MAVQEAQTPLPVPPTGFDTSIVQQEFNAESGHFEPPLKNAPQNISILAPVVAVNILAVTATARPWFYYGVFANTGGAAVTVTITEPGGNTLIVQVPANQTVTLASTPTAPIFISRTAGNINIAGSIATVQCTLTYVMK